MKPKLYVETSVISYLTAHPSRDPIIAARQQITQFWWEQCRNQFDLFISSYVIQEAKIGDPLAAQRRLNVLQDISILPNTDMVEGLAFEIRKYGTLPDKATLDSLHLSVAVSHKIEYLATWNLKHLANPVLRNKIYIFLSDNNYGICIITTPNELLGG
ncbi:MAG: type II toxin-antitoxin system VapC family toxin [Prochlorotrichaceae cyanobacterium]